MTLFEKIEHGVAPHHPVLGLMLAKHKEGKQKKPVVLLRRTSLLLAVPKKSKPKIG